MKAIILGGFEPSGHDAKSDALLHAGRARGHVVALLNWRDLVPCSAHPLFHVHRIGVEMGVPSIAGLLDDPRLSAALTEDLSDVVPVDIDCCISTHPWSTVIAAAAFDHSGTDALLVDSHGEFTPGPLHVTSLDRVDLFAGMTTSGAHPARILDRTRLTGIPVREAFTSESDQQHPRGALTLNTGFGRWAQDASLPFVKEVLASLPIDELCVVGESSRGIARCAEPHGIDVLTCKSAGEIADALRRSRLVVTKASGSMIAEVLACGSVPLYVESGVFWEDDARASLSALGIGVAGTLPFDPSSIARADAATCEILGAQCRSAAASIWEEAEHLRRNGRPILGARSPSLAKRLLAPLGEYTGTRLERTSRAFAEVTEDWLRRARALR